MAPALVAQTTSSESSRRTPPYSEPHGRPNVKLRECTYRIIPLCTTILVVFSIGGGLGYAFNQQALPRNVVVGISIAFLVLGLAFGAGCLKMYHSSHESHISRLDPARSAYTRVCNNTGKLHNRVSRMFGGGQAGEPAADIHGFFPGAARAERGLSNEQWNTITPYANIQAMGSDNNAQIAPEQQSPVRARFQFYPQQLTESPDLTTGRTMDTSISASEQASDHSIGKTPPRMIRKVSTYPKSPDQMALVQMRRKALQPRTDRCQYQPELYPSCTALGQHSGYQEQPNPHVNRAATPGHVGQGVSRNLQIPLSPSNTNKLMSQVANLVKLPKTQGEIGVDGGLILPRSSSKTRVLTIPLHSVEVASTPSTTRIKSHTAEKRNDADIPAQRKKTAGPFVDPLATNNNSGFPEPAFLRPMPGTKVYARSRA